MATRTRYKSPSPAPSTTSTGTMKLLSPSAEDRSVQYGSPMSVDNSKETTPVPERECPSKRKRDDVVGVPGPRRTDPLSIQNLVAAASCEPVVVAGKKRKGSNDDERDSAGSVEPVSMEDPAVRDAVEALEDLRADLNATSPQSSSVSSPQPEPLLELLQSSAPSIVSTAISHSLSTYSATKTYSPSFRYVAESAENLSRPVTSVVSAVGHRTGFDSLLRAKLAGKEVSREGVALKRRKAEKADGEIIRQEGALTKPEEKRGWRSRVMYSSTGLATALSDESRRSLRYCLKILSTANIKLVDVIATLQSILDELEVYLRRKRVAETGADGSLPEDEARHASLLETVEKLRTDALGTLKTVVNTISQYAGGALPENARELVKRQVLAFPVRWQAAANYAACPTAPGSPSTINPEKVCDKTTEDDDGAISKALKVLLMAREGLEMLRSVAEVVQNTLEHADAWCARFGKPRDEGWELDAASREPKRVSWVGEADPKGGEKQSLD